MNTNFSRLIGILALAAQAQSARAELKWEQTSVDLRPGFNDKQAVAHFNYENVGNTPVHLSPSTPRAVVPQRRRKTSRLLPVRRARLLRPLTLAAAPARKSRRLRFRPTIPIPRARLLCSRLRRLLRRYSKSNPHLFIGRMVRSASRRSSPQKQTKTPPSRNWMMRRPLPISLPKSTLALLRMNFGSVSNLAIPPSLFTQP